MTPDNMNIYFTSKDFDPETDPSINLVEKWYGTNYGKEEINEGLINRLSSPSLKAGSVDLPPVNTFLPKNLDIFPPEEGSAGAPKNIFEDERGALWFK